MADTVQARTPHTILGIPTPPRTPPSNERVTRSMPSLVGKRLLGRYQIDAPIGEGGMGLVFRGRHLELGLKVAIKLLRPEFATNPEAVDRFLQEARAASRIRHPNVIEITDFGRTEDDSVFFVMELLDGESLHHTLSAEAAGLPWPRVRHMMRQICDALQAAHDEGVIHRDLKPDNCLRVSRPGDADFIKVLDFGIAKVRARDDEPSTSHTRVGIIVGTPDYIAPEHAKGQSIDHRVDVYAAGVMLYELLTGRLPFRAGSPAEIVALHLSEPVPDPREAREDIPAAVSDIVAKAMAKEPDARFGSMRHLAEALESVPDVGMGPTPKTSGSRRGAWASIAGALAVGAAVVGWTWDRPALTVPSVQPPTATATPLPAVTGDEAPKPTAATVVVPPSITTAPTPKPELVIVDPEPADVGAPPVDLPPAAARNEAVESAPKPEPKPKPKPKPRRPSKPVAEASTGEPAAPPRPSPPEGSGRMSEVKNPFD